MIAARLQAPAPAEPFADDETGLAYFATDFHYEHLVTRLCRHLAATRGFVLVSGAPAPDGELVERAVNARNAAPHRATLVRCRAGMTLDAVTRAFGRRLGLKDDGDGAVQWALLSRLMEDSRKGVVRVLVLENADALDDRNFDELHRFATLDDPHFLPVVLLTARGFAARLDAPSLQFLQPAIVAHLALQHLETEEVAAFIRYQLNATDGRHEAGFTRDAIAAIADAAKGDPAAVNRLARQAIERFGDRSPSAPALLPPPLAAAALPPPAAAAPPPLAIQLPPPPAAAATPPPATAKRLKTPKPVAPRASVPSEVGPAAASPPRAPADTAIPESGARKPARAGALVPALTIAGYVVLAGASAVALFYVLAPGADRNAATLELEAPPAAAPAPDAATAPLPPLVADTVGAPEPAPATPPPPARAVAATEPEATDAESKPSAASIAKVEAEPALPPRAADKSASGAVPPLVRRGEALLTSGDVVSARHFFERAAEGGDAAAACGLGKSYDPLFLQRIGTRGVAGDPAKAVEWYRRAARAGSNEAAARLARLLMKFPQ